MEGRRYTGIGCALTAVLVVGGCGGTVVDTSGLLPPPSYQQAEAAYQRGDLVRARDGFRQFARRNPKSPFVAWSYYWQGKIDLKRERHQEALYAFRQALDSLPEDVLKGSLLLSIGDVHYNRREYKQALDYYRRVDSESLGTTVRQDELYFKTGLCLYRLQDRIQAEKYFRKVELYPGSPYIEEARRRTGRDSALSPQACYVKLGDFSRWESAERVRKQVKEAGYNPGISSSASPDGAMYEVKVEVPGGREEALQIAEELRQRGFSPTVMP